MTGASLWLIVPKPDHPFNKSLLDLITSTLPSDFASYKTNKFTPHVTLTSDIDPEKTYGSTSPQEWLDSLDLNGDFKKEHNEVVVELEELESSDAFFKKITLRAKKNANLLKLAAKCREQTQTSEADAQKWAESEYAPHLSLMYADIDKSVVQKKMGLVELQLGWEFGSLFACCGGMLCGGAKIALVDTTKDVAEWTVLAEREAPWVTWMMARGLI